MLSVLLLTVAALIAIAYTVTERALLAELDSALEQEATAYAAALRSAPSEEAVADATRAYLGGRATEAIGRDVALLVVFTDGRTISSTGIRLEDADGNPVRAASPPDSPELSTVTHQRVTYRVLTAPVVVQGEPAAAFQAAISTATVEETSRRVAYTLAAAGLLSLAIGLPLSYAAARGALAPLRRMAQDARKVSAGDPEQRIAYEGPADELGSLAATLNEMLDRMRRAYEEQRRFVADASHELRTPVAILRGNVELLRSGHLTAGEGADSLAVIEDEAVRMGRLLDELLALARFESARDVALMPLQVHALLEEVASRSKALGERVLTVQGSDDLWIEGDKELLEQALLNLMRNALAHTLEGGAIELTCTRQESRVRLAITDDGSGIPEEDLERIFDRFHRAPGTREESGGGAGLGLAITKQIVELHNGTIAAENVQPHGARFVVELPLADAPDLLRP